MYDNIQGEEWLPINSIPQYSQFKGIFCSNTGKVWSINKYKAIGGYLLKVHINNVGYPVVGLKDKSTGKSKFIKVHRLVCHLFNNPNNCDVSELTVNHLDGDKTNNHYSNLEFCTQRENVQHFWNSELSIAARNKISIGNKGRIPSDEAREKMSISAKNRWNKQPHKSPTINVR